MAERNKKADELGPWSYFEGVVYDFGRPDLVAASVTTYQDAEKPPLIKVQPTAICYMPELGPYAVEFNRAQNDRYGLAIAKLPEILKAAAALACAPMFLREAKHMIENGNGQGDRIAKMAKSLDDVATALQDLVREAKI